MSEAADQRRADAPATGGDDRVWLDVPYGEKDAAKAAGARWDPGERRWYADPRIVTAGRLRELVQWRPRPPVPDLLLGEDRDFGSGLFVDLVPEGCWFTNVRSCIDPGDWDRLRVVITGRVGHRCEACGAPEDRDARRWLEAHERWAYLDPPASGDRGPGVQVLRRLICLCTPCHEVTHFGLAQLRGRAEQAFAHLRTVTGMSEAAGAAHVDEAFATWRARSARTWTLDLSMLTDAGVILGAPPAAADRSGVAAEQTAATRAAEPAVTAGLSAAPGDEALLRQQTSPDAR